MKKLSNDFKQFMKVREKASAAFVNGEIAPLDDISTHVSPATIFGPMGDCVEGARKVNAANAKGARAFAPGSQTRFEIMQSGADGDLAFWTGIQRAKMRMKGGAEPVKMDLRVTEVFRRQDGAWKLIHRHADPLKSPAAKQRK